MSPLRDLVAVDPPAHLDTLVHNRALDELARVHTSASPEPDHPLPIPERYAYAAALVVYGTQALHAIGRVVLRALSG